MVFEEASKFCKKINIAGSFLKIMLKACKKKINSYWDTRNLTQPVKHCVQTSVLSTKVVRSLQNPALKNAFNRHGEICSVLPLSERTKLLCRKPLYGRTPVADRIFDCLAESLNT